MFGATRTTFSYDVADQLVYSQAVAGRTTYVYDNAGNQQIERLPTVRGPRPSGIMKIVRPCIACRHYTCHHELQW